MSLPQVVSADEAFGPHPPGRVLWTVEEVESRVQLAYCHGGPKNGVVYDLATMPSAPPPDAPQNLMIESITYAYRGDIARMSDGRIVRVYYPDDREGAK